MESEKIKLLLPEVMQQAVSDGNLLNAFLEVMAGMHGPSEEILQNLPDYFNPLETQKSMVPYLAKWLNLGELLEFESLTKDLHVGTDTKGDVSDRHNLALWDEREVIAEDIKTKGTRKDDHAATDVTTYSKLRRNGLENLRKLTANALNLFACRGSAEGLRIFLENATGVEGFTIEDQIQDGTETIPFHIRVSAPQSVENKRYLIQKIIEREKPAYVTYELIFEP